MQRSGRFIGLATAAVLTATTLTAALSADANPVGRADPDTARTGVEGDLTSAREGLLDLTADAAAAVRALRQTQTELRASRARLAGANAAVAQSIARVARSKQQLDAARAQEAAGLREVAANAAATEAAQNGRDNLARVAYEDGGGARMALFLDVGSARDLAERAHFVDTISSAQGAVLDGLETERAKALVVQQRLQQARRDVARLTVQTQAELARARGAQDEIAAATTELADLARRRAHQQQALDARKNTEQRRLSALQAQSDRLAAVLAERAERSAKAERATAATATARAMTRKGRPVPARLRSTSERVRNTAVSGSARLVRPTASGVTSSFGMRFHPVLRYSRLHAGMDFAGACGAPVYAADSGEVVRAGTAGGYGNQIVVGHGGALATSYNHLSVIVVRSGPVRRGQLIGRVGTTGLSTGCHLHFEVRESGRPVDPARLL